MKRIMMNKLLSASVFIMVFSIGFLGVNPVEGAVTVYEYNFESGWGNWYSDNGIWEVGEPTYGPDSAHSGLNCAGTILDGRYPYGPDSRLITPNIQLPVVNTNEEIVLRFWHWFSYSTERLGDDNGTVQVRTYENNAWSAWESEGTKVLYSAVWSPDQIDLTEYAGKFIQIGFLHVDRSDAFGHHESSGWYIDDINIEKRTICLFETNVTEGFESGWGCWWASNGVWEIGEPSSGPGSAYSGSNSAATILDGNYPISTDSYLISPPIDLPAIAFPEEILLRFRQWFSYAAERLGDDQGDVRIRTYEEGTWSGWDTLKSVFSYITDWHHERIPLNDYAEKRVQIAFVHIDRSDAFGHHESSGWYIDDVIIETPFRVFADVPPYYWAYEEIMAIYDAGITTGCSQNPLRYCPLRDVSRAAMAVFLERGINLDVEDFTPPPAEGIFDDVPVTHWAADWIEQLYNDGITTGCSQSPLNYCPDRAVNRAAMAVFLLRSEHGSNYTPPQAEGIFDDVPVTHWAADWIEQLYNEGITTGCAQNPLRYCPDRAVNRAAMAVFLSRTFELDL